MRPLRGAGQIPKTIVQSADNGKKGGKGEIIEPTIDELPHKSGHAAEIGRNIKKIEGQKLPKVLEDVVKVSKESHLASHIGNAVLLSRGRVMPSQEKMGKVIATLLGRASIESQGGNK